ncbi:membrane protein [Ureibacillus massiliensis 4400831 = CIP 108448 = CCUG 49529]|uniref:Membrane protein n=1 Tax=Ureibacillus massiliensis 4400831 = CIP 108448 = CCUG 49529 TaxID=1211035 RepID=A0A0A3JX26_9BACL|nr:ECF transporter S component [Ureibacillus massiliensis]KGR91562.1 membrane protein [Ureibacillus massiliensis 4400831 = CIP 108448 = CCUG 49529]
MVTSKLRVLILTALTAAICVVGSTIKVPGFITTAALDSAPAFLSVVYLSPIYSGFAALLGHFATALTSGFPLGIFHILIAAEMFAIVTVFNILHKKGFSIVKWLFLVLTNGLISPIPFYFIISPQFYFASLPSLLIATIINVVVVILIMPVLNKILRQWKVLNL